VWEHKHIANEDLTSTFWALLKLGEIPNANVPTSWAGTNYDFFWIVDYTKPQPTFTVVPQVYTSASYAKVPNNAWGVAVDRRSSRNSIRIASSSFADSFDPIHQLFYLYD
jgi:hypothetical protein